VVEESVWAVASKVAKKNQRFSFRHKTTSGLDSTRSDPVEPSACHRVSSRSV